ncbi:MAG TPA: beta-propeller domain-containing protein, partial [Pyrinomonadaceae bacterium]|nr:beta-propeller domain-containing protein [Pyrinomonadaceae bacterium]
MKPFRSDRELKRYLQEAAEKYRRARAQETQAAVMVSSAETVAVSSQGADESVTNTQHEGVDEGGIVKLHGNHLVILRRGRLFTIAIGNGALRPVSSIDAFGPDLDPDQAWYDEMLISGDTIAVVGYSYKRSGTEVGLFNIDSQGQLSYRSTYTLRSNDYYSSRNYASRLIGSKLIFYNGLYFNPNTDDPFASFPAVRKWHKGGTDEDFRRIVSYSRVYRPAGDFDVQYGVTLHTVTTCDLARGFDCQATTVVGPHGNVFYVSPESVYVWAVASAWYSDTRGQSFLFRMPLDGSGPSALRVSGGPVDQFSFLQSKDHHLNVLVRAESKGDGMWGAEVSQGEVALMR